MVRSVKEALDSRKAIGEWERKIDEAIDKQFAGADSEVRVGFDQPIAPGTVWAITQVYAEAGWTVEVTQPTLDMRNELNRGVIVLKAKKG